MGRRNFLGETVPLYHDDRRGSTMAPTAYAQCRPWGLCRTRSPIAKPSDTKFSGRVPPGRSHDREGRSQWTMTPKWTTIAIKTRRRLREMTLVGKLPSLNFMKAKHNVCYRGLSGNRALTGRRQYSFVQRLFCLESTANPGERF